MLGRKAGFKRFKDAYGTRPAGSHRTKSARGHPCGTIRQPLSEAIPRLSAVASGTAALNMIFT